MKKKLLAFVLCTMILFNTSLAAHATENGDVIIEPYSSTFVQNLMTDNYTSIYTDTIPALLPTTVTVTNDKTNPGDIIVRVINEKNKVIVDEKIISEGDSETLTIMPDLLALWQGDYTLQVKAAMTNGIYGVKINKGSTGENIKIIHANKETYTYTDTLSFSTSSQKKYTVTNHMFSPGTVALALEGASNGKNLTAELLPAPNLLPGESVTITIQSDINQDVKLSTIAINIEGAYYITVDEVK